MSTKTLKTHVLGIIRSTGGAFVITDPCYLRDHEVGTLQDQIDVPHTDWEASVRLSDEGDWGTRTSRLIVTRIDRPSHRFSHRITGLGVDAGMMMVLDVGRLPDWRDSEDLTFEDSGDLTYDGACGATCGPNSESRLGGILGEDAAVVSNTGYGDGMYSASVYVDEAGKVSRIEIDFGIEEEDDAA